MTDKSEPEWTEWKIHGRYIVPSDTGVCYIRSYNVFNKDLINESS